MIDIHSHILPGIDDGAKDMNMSLDMLKIAVNSGTKQIVATPHYYRGYYENSYEDIGKLVNEVNSTAERNNINIQVILGQEVFLDSHTLELYKEGIIGCIGDTRYMLVELPMDSMPKNALDIIYELKVEGVRPIIAHPERYSYIIEKPSKINEFIQEGCLFQINAGSIEGIFGKKVQKTSKVLIDHGICDFIASDAHTTGRRTTNISNALQIVASSSDNFMDKIINNGKNLLKNNSIYSNSERIREKKGFFSFFKFKEVR